MTTHSGMATTTANWHWKNKNVTPWARQWFEQQLTAIAVSGDGDEGVVSVTQVTDIDGDVELGQRKSKLITIFDCKIELTWSGTAADGSEVAGSLTIPEVSHETSVDGTSDYAYHWTLTSKPSPPADALYHIARTRLPPALEAKFAEFPLVLLDTHGKDLKVAGVDSRNATPAPSSSSPAPTPSASGTARPSAAKPDKASVNTSTVTVEARFMAAADDLFGLLTDEKRIPIWSRAPATSRAEVGAQYSLFGGGIKGEYTALNPPTRIVQTWALQSPTWPAGHDAILTTTLTQSSDSTVLKLSLAGVPTGMEDEIKGNIEGYYIHGFKSIGLGTEL